MDSTNQGRREGQDWRELSDAELDEYAEWCEADRIINPIVVGEMIDMIRGLQEQLAEARAAISVRNECIEKWGGHMAWCNVFKYAHGVFAGGPCHCGWAEWEVRLAALEPQPQPRSVGGREEETNG